MRNIAQVTIAVANGDLSQKITAEAKGEILQLKDTMNKMVDQLNAFASEVTRVAKEVGTEGKLGGQAAVKGVAGIWKDLTDNVNLMVRKPDRTGEKYSPGDYRSGKWRPFAEDYRRGEGRNPPVERHDEQDGGPA